STHLFSLSLHDALPISLLVLSAWCLGVLNSHRKFFLSYSAPVAYNVVMIISMLIYGPGNRHLSRLAVSLAWASVLGSGLQFGVQDRKSTRLNSSHEWIS